ncbi:hypothetical protein N9137_03200 [Pseudomonadales bacterium]|nr:hypothetical protein [Pseudomonadales bacterium]
MIKSELKKMIESWSAENGRFDTTGEVIRWIDLRGKRYNLPSYIKHVDDAVDYMNTLAKCVDIGDLSAKAFLRSWFMDGDEYD